ncbi:MAG: aminopeptidase N [Betaproteobacteria bacterium HGW-Betaproteobacteria-11]|nr:MAG: aminopeptidase N [Betaproteobacteria bacterium HGW-Betaproteobacteria-11]
MRTETPHPIYLKDYAPPAWWVDRIDLQVAIHEGFTEVRASLELRRNPQGTGGALVLDGEGLSLQELGVGGTPLDPAHYALATDGLTIHGPLPEAFQLDTVVRIEPDLNTRLSGLYRSRDGYFTQCEAEGFRRLTFFPDRPDVMARYTCTIEAERERFPHLLSNGNLVATGEVAGEGNSGRHWARWEDPFPKPCYLFALVAARLDVLEDRFITASGRQVRLAVYVEPGKRDQCGHALAALKQAMRWDEARFGLELDLDQYMIVAVGDFNMGAMENKGLNIFNTRYVLARPDTASDSDYQNIDRVVGHEYFHNWTGNRVTCRDWFQLSLKEGLTVFRDQEFGADVHSRAVSRIQDVRQMRLAQFPEDAGPMAHPVRPASYAAIDNFYTATVYQKGAEVVRMIQTLIGGEAFRRGMELYFRRHDGQAVTCEDFVAAMEDAGGIDLTQFRRWYARAGTPRLAARGEYDARARRYTLHLAQSLEPSAYERRLAEAGLAVEAGPLHIPLAVGLVLPDGGDALAEKTRVLSLTGAEQSFVFEEIAEAPVVSLLRGFSAPVQLDFAQTDDQLAHLMAHDSDPFNRWEAGQRLASRVLLAGIRCGGEGGDWIPDAFVAAVGRLLVDGPSGDPALAAEALTLPAEQVLAEEVAGCGETIDPEAIHRARLNLRRHLAAALREGFEAVWQTLDAALAVVSYAPEPAQIGRRALRNLALGYLAESEESHLRASVTPRLMQQFHTGGNMTDVSAALGLLANLDLPQREEALAAFYAKWKGEALVVDKWLQLQATSRLAGTTARVRELLAHPAFTLKNPNKVYALVRSFCAANPRHFHAADGSGYRLAVEVIGELQALNPQVAARVLRSFDRWRMFDGGRQAQALAALEQLAALPELEKDVGEVLANLLADSFV